MNNHNEKINLLIENIEKVIIGKHNVVQKAICALIAGGNVLLEDVPGIGKTMLVKALSISLGCTFKRIQFTPDLLPSDITGISIYNQKIGDFEFKAGPIMNQIILADEINRTSPKTQSSLLEAMDEHQITVDNNTYKLKEPFIVFATQNPIEYEGTFPLPEAQLDRFMIKISIGYPDINAEKEIIRKFKFNTPINDITAVISSEDIIKLQDYVKNIYVDESIDDYIINIINQTRNNKDIQLGASPRGTLALFRAAQAFAVMNGREYVLPDDVKEMIKPVLAHRIIIKPDIKLQGFTAEDVLNNIIKQVYIPVGRRYA